MTVNDIWLPTTAADFRKLSDELIQHNNQVLSIFLSGVTSATKVLEPLYSLVTTKPVVEAPTNTPDPEIEKWSVQAALAELKAKFNEANARGAEATARAKEATARSIKADREIASLRQG